MQYTFQELYRYCEEYSYSDNDVLYELERETHLKTLAPQMLTGKLQGSLLRLFSLMMQPDYILEIGTFTGYSSICLAAGLKPSGQLHTIEVNPELEYISEKYFKKAGIQDRVTLHVVDAFDILPKLSLPWDIVHIDAKKKDYSDYFDLVVEDVRPGGLILTDNVLWSGKVIDEKSDKQARALHEYNKKLAGHPDVETLVLPLRDGLSIARKR